MRKVKALRYLLICTIVVGITGCSDKKSLEKDGGAEVTVSIGYDTFIRQIAAIPGDSVLLSLINAAKKEPCADFSGFMKSFAKAADRTAPDIKFSSFFFTPASRAKISFLSTNEEVIAYLIQEWKNTMAEVKGIILKRLYFLVQDTADLIRTETDRFIIMVPGILDAARAGSYFAGTGKLEFWETYENNQLFLLLKHADEFMDSIRDAVTDNEPEESIEDLLKSEDLFFSGKLYPACDQEGKLYPGPVVGFAEEKDTAEILRILRGDDVSALFPDNCIFSWSLTPINGGYFPLLALRASDRNGQAALGNCTVNSISFDQSKQTGLPEIYFRLDDHSSLIWKRITTENIGRSIAIVVDNRVCSYPTVQAAIENGKTVMTGNYKFDEASDLCNILKSGTYTVPVTVEKIKIIKPVKPEGKN